MRELQLVVGCDICDVRMEEQEPTVITLPDGSVYRVDICGTCDPTLSEIVGLAHSSQGGDLCPECGHSFKNERGLKLHRAKMHQDKQVKTAKKETVK